MQTDDQSAKPDIVKQLRDYAQEMSGYTTGICRQAAAEIERLRAQLRDSQANRGDFNAGFEAALEAVASQHERWADLCDCWAEIAPEDEAEERRRDAAAHRRYASRARDLKPEVQTSEVPV
jgi:hypothetical protein